jgi:hypothetical protein
MKKILVMLVCAVMAFSAQAEDRFWGFSLTPEKQVPTVRDNVKGIRLGIYGEHYDVNGLDLCLGIAQVDHDLKGASFSIVKNEVGGQVTGLQATIGKNNVEGNLWGVQDSWIWNRAVGKTIGAQLTIGFNEIYGNLRGAQIACGASVAQNNAEIWGFQMGAYSQANTLHGVQFGIYNVANEVHGLQFGIVNKTVDMDGIQIGICNFIENSDLPFMVIVNAKF